VTDDLDPWPFAGRVAGLVARSYPLAESYHIDHLASQMKMVVGTANRAVEEETGLALPGAPTVAIVDRRQWVDRNVSSFQKLIEPAERRIAERISLRSDTAFARDVAHRLVGAETGAILGFLARRVLGQYELVVPNDDEADSIAFVGANILQMERSQQLRPDEFRMWIALHESAHRAQFVGVPWLRPYFFGLVTELVDASVPEPGRLGRLVQDLVAARRQGTPLIDETGLMGLFASPAQRSALDRVQALMSLLEGHGHVVMDRLGERSLRTQRRMAALLKARRNDPRTAAFFRLTGLEMKMRQYEMGERFVLDVERRAGWHALSTAWSGAEALPTLREIEEPGEWLRRVG
jgi:coenzyme F420 biosynthesis associated uncharacterized protein